MAPKAKSKKRSDEPVKLTKTKANQVMKDLHAVLDEHGVADRIHAMEFASGPPCTCPDGRPGVLRVVNGQLICFCGG